MWPPTSDDLRVFLGMPQIDTDRATLLLSLAQDLCETIVSPIDSRASAVVLAVAARAFVNAAQLQQGTLGPATVVYGTTATGGGYGGLYLSRQDKSNLRRLSGRTAAFTTSVLPTGANAVQSLTITATAGTFTLSLAQFVSAPIAFNPTAAAIVAALAPIPPIPGNISVTGTGPFLIEFINDLGTTNVPVFTVNATALTGTAVVQTVTTGIPKPGQELPPWDRDYYNGPKVLGNQAWGGIW